MPAAESSMSTVPRTEASRRVAIIRGLRRHGAEWRDVARRQAEVATRAAADFEDAGDPSMAEMLRGHADHLMRAATLPAVRRRPADASA